MEFSKLVQAECIQRTQESQIEGVRRLDSTTKSEWCKVQMK